MSRVDTDRAGDIGEFEELKRGLDTRLIPQMKAEDDYEDSTITKVEPYTDGHGWSVSMGSLCLGVPRIEGKPEPHAGDTIRVYSKGLGFAFHGIDLNGVEVFYRTPYERLAERVRWLAEYDRKQRERLAEQGSEYEAQVAALPGPLRERIKRFERQSPSFWLDSGGYELFCCTEAAKIAEALSKLDRDDDWALRVAWFRSLKFEEQQRIADISDGHSGNTFGVACMLAQALLEGVPA